MIKSLVFLATYQCNARCDYCDCGPDVLDRLTGDDLIRYINEAKKLGTISQVIFTGGEPTLLGEDLFKAISHANSLGLLTRVVTNGSWGKNQNAAEYILDKFIASGLTEINISIDDLHQQWIPLEHAKNAFLACYRKRFKCLIAHKSTKNAIITKKYLDHYFGVELIDYDPEKNYRTHEECRLISGGIVVPVGRKSERLTENDLIYGKMSGNCDSILRDIVVGANHQLLPCCGIITKNLPELTLGDLRKKSLIEAIDEANNDIIINWLALEGPISIAYFIKWIDPSVNFDKKYVNKCHLCNEIFTREDLRTILNNNIDKISARITMHRAFFEAIRMDNEIMQLYCPRKSQLSN